MEAKNKSVSDYNFLKNYSKSSSILNNSTKNKLLEFVVMIKSIKAKLESLDVFEITRKF